MMDAGWRRKVVSYNGRQLEEKGGFITKRGPAGEEKWLDYNENQLGEKGGLVKMGDNSGITRVSLLCRSQIKKNIHDV